MTWTQFKQIPLDEKGMKCYKEIQELQKLWWGGNLPSNEYNEQRQQIIDKYYH